ncbi:minichromosome maintenance domain-containing protein 2 isoform X2 [Canis lupus baileyi]|uniref:minichromosome maintenance domain-containing protein 2 isoform X2 n=1 Tax=Canis lupus familiaris TaxID=9615 RepID=UPI000BAA2711|nr:minichromosome maintenance domain-containing protein 2 isoform X2 [Canis lupus familiaris]XP_038297224.1 minichromosome maintenance domain-containing protein 2 isoform X2 [Canis lupus familiaris]XP_038435362.1 minichromosome maintenance domain-containing protein 2 isoform X2 [Canis lupus familiaris]|eukprot:XP_022268066.1 MCM domain-containing protein 2 isoform X2 [Canis lupus familiaris]
MSNLKMKEAALIYLDRSGGLQKFIDDCKSYNDSKQSYAVYRFNILINPSDITELDAELGNHILHQPLKAAQVFQSINIVLKLTHLPQLRSYSLDLCEFPLDYASQRFYMMQGIVISMTTVTKYTQGARFLCSDEACPLSKGFQYIRVHVPGATESATVRNDFLCNLCSSSLQEDRKFRVLGDKQIVEIITAKALQAFKGYSNNQPFRFQSLTIFLRDESVGKMNIGSEYKIIGIPTCVKTSQTAVCIEANSIIFCNPKVPSGISNNFKDLLSLTSNSCWKFTAILANIFASQIVPPGTYNLLKLCLLMSLVQTCDRNKELKDCLDILIITSDTLLIDRLLNFSINLVPRGIRNPVSTEIFPTLTRNKYGTGAVSIQAGSALLAKGGICFIGDLASHKKDKLEQLQSVLESRSITVYIPGKKFGNDVNQHMTFPVQCSFWSFVDMDSSSRKNMQKTNTLIGQMDCSLIPANLLETFGLLINCNESSSFYPLLSTVQHTLKKAIDPEGQLYVASKNFTTEDFEKLLAFAKNLNVEFSLEAERMIHGYYLASRRIRTDSISGSKLSASALKYLVSLAEAHARLSLRNKVLKEDALIAALLFETSLTLKYGATVFCVAPSAVFPFELYNEEYLEQRDIYLTQCQQQLQQFIATYGPGTAIFTSDE